MKRRMMKMLLVILALDLLVVVLSLAVRPYISGVLDPDFGFAVSARTSTGQKFEPLFAYRFEK